MNPIVKIDNMSVIFDEGTPAETVAVKDINLDVYPKEYMVIFGPSGCGKSTILYLLAGLLSPSKGKIKVHNHFISDYNEEELTQHRRKNTGIIFQSFNLISTLNVLENVVLPLGLQGVSKRKRETIGLKLLKDFDLTDLILRTPQILSGGQQQRVAIVRALINDPDIILADEPVGNLDSKSAEVVMDHLLRLNENGKTIILVTHDPRHLRNAHRVVYMKDGVIEKQTLNSHKEFAHFKDKKINLITEDKRLAAMYPSLPLLRLKAKVITEYLNQNNTLNVIARERFENILEAFLSHRDFKKLLDLLDKSFKDDGVGLYRQTALSYSQFISDLLEISPLNKPTDIDTFLEKYIPECEINKIQKDRLHSLIEKRISEKLSKNDMLIQIDMPFKDGGLGLREVTAQCLTQIIEITLVDYA